MDVLHLLLLLLAVHALCDFPLQGDFLAKAKDPVRSLPGVPWWCAMAAHCLIHAGGVLVVTGSSALASIELVAHGAIDVAKCRSKIDFATDQALHVLCKVAYAEWITLLSDQGVR